MKNIITLLSIFLTSFVFGQDIIYKDFNSIELGETKTLKIYIPPSYEENKEGLYPLTILFDGDYLFDVYVGNSKLFSKRDKAPEQIIVGIMQGDKRYKDCAYDKVTGLPNEESNKFYRFVRGELLEYLEKKYNLSPFRTLVGNTLTANFVNYFIIEDSPVFDAYICINPYYNKDMPSLLHSKIGTNTKEKVYYYLNSGSYNNPEKHKQIEQVNTMLVNLNDSNIDFKYDTFNKSTKVASIGQAIPSALAHVFDIYSAISKQEFATKVKHLTPPDAIAYLETKYVEIDYLFGTNMKIRERDIYAIESIIIDQEEGIYLEEFGNMIFRLYPESPLSDYYIGMYHELGKDYKKALKNYKNGYSKMDKDGDSENAEAFYQNIERIKKIQENEALMEQEEKDQKAEEKELKKLMKQQEKEERMKEKTKKSQKEEIKKRKKLEEEHRERMEQEEEERLKKYRKKKDD